MVYPGTVTAPSDGRDSNRTPPVALYAATVLVSAFLLFQVQPLIGRFILPWFGGVAGVWTVALLFFQVTLVIGYFYAHFIVGRLALRRQVVVHVALVGIALVALPIIPDSSLAPDGPGSPAILILILLTLTVGLPYLVLSTTGPLLQAWFAMTHPERSPYRLYALSNAGSLIALVSYPLAVERFVPLRTQAWAWSGGFLVFVGLVAALSWQLRGAAVIEVSREAIAGTLPSRASRLLWLALPTVASVLLISVTAELTTNVSPVPLLWIVPLAIYLISFILTFDSSRWYRRRVFVPLAAGSVTFAALLQGDVVELGLVGSIVGYSIMLFATTMSLHGELVILKPEPQHLTRFYLMVAIGGASGGLFTGLLAPLIFDGLWELHVGLALTLILLLLTRYATTTPPRVIPATLAWGAIAILVIGLAVDVRLSQAGVVASERNFYGVLNVREVASDDPSQRHLRLVHGSVIHGLQFADPQRAHVPVSYYSEDSGVGIAIEALRESGALRIGVIGLGTGVIAAYGQPDDVLTFLEINPEVESFAEQHFTYLSAARARGSTVSVLIGDGRLVLERQTAAGESQGFDLLVLDAFSSDAIPTHLLTVEAFDVYLRHLSSTGVVAFHISNRYLDLSPVVGYLASTRGMEALAIDAEANVDGGVQASSWILVTANLEFVDHDAVRSAARASASPDVDLVRWTDDFSNIFSVLR